MPQKPLPLIISLKRWREQNGFSQSDAVKVLNKQCKHFVFEEDLCDGIAIGFEVEVIYVAYLSRNATYLLYFMNRPGGSP